MTEIAIGIDLGGTRIKAVTIDATGNGIESTLPAYQ
jgi:predicted NBD/HSP70 family sugar kinase